MRRSEHRRRRFRRQWRLPRAENLVGILWPAGIMRRRPCPASVQIVRKMSENLTLMNDFHKIDFPNTLIFNGNKYVLGLARELQRLIVHF